MTSELLAVLCQFDSCTAGASCMVNAQWSPFDFIDYLSCDEHAIEMMRILWNRLVDDLPPVDVWTVHFDPERT
jgi:hypothetical protein